MIAKLFIAFGAGLKKSNKYGFFDPFIVFDKKSCVTKTSTMGYNKKAAKEATKLVKEFFTETLMK